MRFGRTLLGLATLLAMGALLAACASAPTPTPTPSTTAPAPATGSPAAPSGTGNVEAGKAIFATQCNGCHPNGEKGVGPDIKGKPSNTVKTKVRQGGGGMPAFTPDKINDQQLNDLAAYVASLK